VEAGVLGGEVEGFLESQAGECFSKWLGIQDAMYETASLR